MRDRLRTALIVPFHLAMWGGVAAIAVLRSLRYHKRCDNQRQKSTCENLKPGYIVEEEGR